MVTQSKTVIVTGASQGIGAGIVRAFLEHGYNVVATSRRMSKSGVFATSERVALVDGDIGDSQTSDEVVKTAISRFGRIDALVNNAGLFFSKPFVDYTAEDFRSLVAVNLAGFLFLTQRVIRQMLAQPGRGSIVTITSSLSDHPLATLPASVPMITKGGLNAASRNLAIEYAKDGIRVNTVSPGLVDTPLLSGASKGYLRSLSPLGVISDPKDIADAVLYVTEARHITGEVLHVDGGAHLGKW